MENLLNFSISTEPFCTYRKLFRRLLTISRYYPKFAYIYFAVQAIWITFALIITL
ncbi:hypothetical protein PIN17_A0424 [Prevotella intermedia 17]|nr:hypothetical protein PIN17_A0424 [Prevotella intermedia 17]